MKPVYMRLLFLIVFIFISNQSLLAQVEEESKERVKFDRDSVDSQFKNLDVKQIRTTYVYSFKELVDEIRNKPADPDIFFLSYCEHGEMQFVRTFETAELIEFIQREKYHVEPNCVVLYHGEAIRKVQ